MVNRELGREDFLKRFEMSEDQIPDYFILEGTAPPLPKMERRKEFYDDIILEYERSLPFFIGVKNGVKIGHSCTYGPSCSGELAHQFSILGSDLIHIGSCGGLQGDLKIGDFIIPTEERAYDAFSGFYVNNVKSIKPSRKYVNKVCEVLEERNLPHHRGKMISFPSIFAESKDLIKEWSWKGYLAVEVEFASTFAVANHFNVDAFALAYILDLPIREQSIYEGGDEFDRTRSERKREIMEVVFDVIENS
ncbi:MAG: hypothetical protein ABEK17_01155 [Candidatus Aenigmatarchaeota archaeon]